MRRSFAHRAEVTRRADQALAEMMLPDAVDDHAGRERVVFVRDRIGQFEPSAALRKRRGVIWAQYGEKPSRGVFADILRAAANMHLHVLRRAVLERVNERI